MSIAGERGEIVLRVQNELERIQRTESESYQEIWGKMLPVSLPELDQAISDRMFHLGYTQVSSSYFNKPFSVVAWEEERSEMRVTEVHVFRDEQGENFKLYIMREVREEGDVKVLIEIDELDYRRAELHDLSLILGKLNVPVDVTDPMDFMYL